MRRNVRMLYIIENNGVYGLTKGQFSASADIGSKAKKGEINMQPPIDPVLTALAAGATFVARSFSGDKAQLVPLIKAGLSHDGFALIDVLSPCVTFNDHEDSTKSYAFTASSTIRRCTPISCRRPRRSARLRAGRRDGAWSCTTAATLRCARSSRLRPDQPRPGLREDSPAHPGRRVAHRAAVRGAGREDMHGLNKTVAEPLATLPHRALCPGAEALERTLARYR
jgi:2-oxoglutarate/2-oxoacid ferredoxin oxidoreductase subunit beta